MILQVVRSVREDPIAVLLDFGHHIVVGVDQEHVGVGVEHGLEVVFGRYYDVGGPVRCAPCDWLVGARVEGTAGGRKGASIEGAGWSFQTLN